MQNILGSWIRRTNVAIKYNQFVDLRAASNKLLWHFPHTYDKNYSSYGTYTMPVPIIMTFKKHL